MLNMQKKELIQSSAIFIVTALLSFWLDSRAQSALVRYTDDINIGLKKVERYHETGQVPAK